MKIKLKKNQLKIYFTVRDFVIKFTKDFLILDFIYSILLGFLKSPVLVDYPHLSFCRPFKDNQVYFYINGFGKRNYFEDIYYELMKA